MKSKRQQEILRIIEERDVETQDQLLSELKARGVQSTQATISRDIKELHLVKELTGYGTYKYAVSGAQDLPELCREAAHHFQGGGHFLRSGAEYRGIENHARPGLRRLLRHRRDGDPESGRQPGRRRHRYSDPAHQ